MLEQIFDFFFVVLIKFQLQFRLQKRIKMIQKILSFMWDIQKLIMVRRYQIREMDQNHLEFLLEKLIDVERR